MTLCFQKIEHFSVWKNVHQYLRNIVKRKSKQIYSIISKLCKLVNSSIMIRDVKRDCIVSLLRTILSVLGEICIGEIYRLVRDVSHFSSKSIAIHFGIVDTVSEIARKVSSKLTGSFVNLAPCLSFSIYNFSTYF